MFGHGEALQTKGSVEQLCRDRRTECISGTEMGDRLRAIIADCKGALPNILEWEQLVQVS